MSKLTDEELADVARRIESGVCAICDGARFVEYNATGDEKICGACEGTGAFALATTAAESIIAELRSLRALLATEMPENRSVYWYDNSPRGMRVGFVFHGEDHVTNIDGAAQLGAALLRAVIAARAALEAKGGDK